MDTSTLPEWKFSSALTVDELNVLLYGEVKRLTQPIQLNDTFSDMVCLVQYTYCM